MNKNQSILMMSAIVVLFFACAGFGYSSMINKARALKAESELAGLRKDIDANLSKKTPGATEKRRTANPPASTNSGFANVQNPEPAADGRNDNSNQNRGRNSLENLKESDPERSVALQQFAKQIGYRSDQAAQFEEYVKNVYAMTSANPFMQGGGRGGGGNRGQGQ